MSEALTSQDVLIQTEKLDEARSFYEQELGFTVFLEQANLIGLEAGGFRLFLERGPALGPVFEVFVSDVEEAKLRLVGRGGRVEAEDPAVPKCYVRDPFGLTYNLAKRR